MGRGASILLLAIAACGVPPSRTVPRVVDGKVEQGPFVSPYAYEWFIQGEAAAAKGEHDDAALAFETASAAPADDVLLMTRLAEEYEMAGESRRADRTLALAGRYYPKSAQVALARGRVHERRGEPDAALSAFIRARRLAPGSEEPVVAMARALDRQGHRERAKALLLEYISTEYEADREGARRLLIELAVQSGDAETLKNTFTRSPAATEDQVRAAAKLALDTGQPALAVRLLEDTLEVPENQALWLRALVASGDREAASAFLSTAQSARLGGVVRHAELLLEVGALEVALTLLSVVSPTPRAQYLRGKALLGLGDYLGAAQAFSDVPFGSASFEEARIGLAECSIAQGRAGIAAEALSLAPHHSLATRVKLAEAHLDEGNLRAGLRLFDAKRASERAAIAVLFERAGHFREAAAYYATVNVPASADPRVHARATAERLASRSHHRAAVAVLERWTTSAPEDLYGRVRLVELLRDAGEPVAANEEGRATLPLIDDPRLRAHLVTMLDASK